MRLEYFSASSGRVTWKSKWGQWGSSAGMRAGGHRVVKSPWSQGSVQGWVLPRHYCCARHPWPANPHRGPGAALESPFGHHRQGADLQQQGPGDPSCEGPVGTWAWAHGMGGGLIHSPGAFVWLLLRCSLGPSLFQQGCWFTFGSMGSFSAHTAASLGVECLQCKWGPNIPPPEIFSSVSFCLCYFQTHKISHLGDENLQQY